MREIKFRGKRIDNGEWVYGDLSTKNLFNEPMIYEEEWADYAVIPETVGQYTGLKDKNGVEIYEGDLLQFEDYPPQEVVWEDGGFAVEDYYLADWYDGAVVIGNIHDNPELMEGGSKNGM